MIKRSDCDVWMTFGTVRGVENSGRTLRINLESAGCDVPVAIKNGLVGPYPEWLLGRQVSCWITSLGTSGGHEILSIVLPERDRWAALRSVHQVDRRPGIAG